MSLGGLLLKLAPLLEVAEVNYMLTGSVASSAHGEPRATRDLDVVIAPTRAQLLALVRAFSSKEYYADEEQALEALAQGSQFNVIEYSSGWKVDFIIAENTKYGRTALERRRSIEIAGSAVFVASAEDVLIAKLRWAKLGSSEVQLRDAAGIIAAQASGLDRDYVMTWVHELGLQEEWRKAQQK